MIALFCFRFEYGRRSGRSKQIVNISSVFLGTRSVWRRWLFFSLLLAGGVGDFTRVAVGAAVAGPKTVYTYDARPLKKLDLRQRVNAETLWDTMHVAAALQGLANRQEPRLYLYYSADFGVETDEFWMNWLRGEDGWLKAFALKPLASVDEMVETFRGAFKGLVVYDPAVPATACVASTASGCLDLLPVRYSSQPDSWCQRLQAKYPVKLWLVNPDGTSKFTGAGRLPDYEEPSSGSAKVDAYRWAIRRFLRSGLCAPRFGAYYIDSAWINLAFHAGPEMHTLANHDYFIAQRAFFFDLSPWGDEAPNDDLRQPLGADLKAFKEVLLALYDAAGGEIIKVGGFPPWPFKYTDAGGVGCKHGGVETEWEFGRLISQYNGYMEADAAGLAGLANASFARHYPLEKRYYQKAMRPNADAWRARGHLDAQGKVVPKLYIGHYVGDYDAPSWLNKAVPVFFNDPARGQVPMGWAFDPNLSDRAPWALVYAYRHATTNDYFIAGDSGAGYLNPRGLTVRPDSGLPSGLEAWKRHCARCYNQWDMTITGFVLDGSAGTSTELEYAAYKYFSPDGFGTHYDKKPCLHAGVGACGEYDLPEDPAAAAKVLADAAQAGHVKFFWARSILRTPKWYAQVEQKLRENHPQVPFAVVDPYTFFGLIAIHEGGATR